MGTWTGEEPDLSRSWRDDMPDVDSSQPVNYELTEIGEREAFRFRFITSGDK